VAGDFDYVALCDQDDVWHPDRLSRAVALLSERDATMPLLYASECVYCDHDMRPTGRSHLNRIGVSFATTLYENIASGNTQVLNRTLAQLVAEAGVEGVYYHDWWVALVASALGEVVFDERPSIDYRRTGENVSPSGTKRLALLRYRIKNYLQGGQLAQMTGQPKRLRELYGAAMPAERRALLDHFLDGGRLSKAFTPRRLRQHVSAEVALRLLFLLGLL
jgi:glycosyltransferase involved in cell wall biosynthesis